MRQTLRSLAVIAIFFSVICHARLYAQHNNNDSNAQGCLPVANGSLNVGSATRLQPFNESCRRLLAEEQLWKGRLNVSADIYLINATNASTDPPAARARAWAASFADWIIMA